MTVSLEFIPGASLQRTKDHEKLAKMGLQANLNYRAGVKRELNIQVCCSRSPNFPVVGRGDSSGSVTLGMGCNLSAFLL